MASEELKEIRKALTKEAIREHQMARTGGTQTDLFTCGRCRKKSCAYTQVGRPLPASSEWALRVGPTPAHAPEDLLLEGCAVLPGAAAGLHPGPRRSGPW